VSEGKKYKVHGEITIHLRTEFTEDGTIDLDMAAFQALADYALEEMGGMTISGEIDVEGFTEIPA